MDLEMIQEEQDVSLTFREVVPGSPSYRFMGYVESFKAAGFEEVGRAGSRRHVLRLRVK
jgi:hypothetical protein